MKTAVYINYGRFVVDCSHPDCTDARLVEPGQKSATCATGHRCDLDWPDKAPQVMAALQERLSEKRRNWFPKDHPLAAAIGAPHGQSIRELRAEAVEGEASDAAALAEHRTQLLAQMRDLGVTAEEATAALKGT